MIVEVSSHGSTIKRDHELFVITDKDGTRNEVPSEKINCLVVSANALVSTAAIRLCVERHIQLIISQYGGKPVARLWSSTPGRASQIRRKQYTVADPKIFDICKKILLTKAKRQRQLLAQLQHNRKTDSISDVIDSITASIKTVKEEPYHAEWKARFLGFEGSIAQKYFSCIGQILPQKYQFSARSQHPGLDPFNATLNYLYGMGYNTVEKAVIMSALDPHAGFYHADGYGKPTLAYDIIEYNRATIDKLAITLFARRQVSDTWFEKQDDGSITLTKQARYALIQNYRQECEKKIETESYKICTGMVKELLEENK